MEQQKPRSYGVSTAFAAIRAKIVPILLAGLVVAAAAAAFTASKSSEYAAEAIVFPRDPGFANQAFDSQSFITAPQAQLADTDLASIDAVSDQASEDLDGKLSASTIRNLVDVTDTGTGLILIDSTGSSGAEAADVANAYASAAVETRRDSQVAVIDSARETAEDSLKGMKPGSVSAQRLQRQIDDLDAYRDFQTGNIEQVQKATVPVSPMSKPVLSSAVAGGIAGLLLGLAVALVADRIRPRLTGRGRAEELFGVPVLTTLPPGSPEDPAAMESLRARLLHQREAEVPPTMLVVPAAGEPAGEVARGLAGALAAVGRRALFVDARLKDGGGGAAGLAQVLAGSASAQETIEAGAEGAPDVLASGGPRADSATLLDGPRTRTLLDELADRYDEVVIAAPPPGAGPDAIPLMSAAGMTLALVTTGSREDECTALAREIGAVSAASLGGVVLLEG